MAKNNDPSISVKKIAQWMYDSAIESELYQIDAVNYIAEKFGEIFIYENQNGNPAISKEILKEFRKISGNDIIWERYSRSWRRRTSEDSPGRQQY